MALLFTALLLILAAVLFLAAAPNWLVCGICVIGGWWAASLLESEPEVDVEVFCVADWSKDD